ncbi:MAG: SGNH/GDSL hydrolase family protein [Acidiferrobacterales bacterium]
MNIICFGDSITEGAEFVPMDRWPTVLQSRLDVLKPSKFTVHNRGVGSDTTTRGFDRLDSDVLPLLPGLLLVQFGFNDGNVRDWAMVPRVGVEEFKRNLREFHRIAHAQQGQCVFVVNHTIAAVSGKQGNGKSYNENLQPYNPAIRAVAQQLGAPAIDLPMLMAQRRVDLETLLTDDRLHLSVPGNQIYADIVFDMLVTILRGWEL